MSPGSPYLPSPPLTRPHMYAPVEGLQLLYPADAVCNMLQALPAQFQFHSRLASRALVLIEDFEAGCMLEMVASVSLACAVSIICSFQVLYLRRMAKRSALWRDIEQLQGGVEESEVR